MTELNDLRERVRALEQENDSLRVPRRRPRARSVVAVIVLAVTVLLAPVAAIGTWARLQLVDADQFVATFAPLADDPEVQDFVAGQVSSAIHERVDLGAVVGEVFDGLRALGLPPRASSALTLLEAPAASGAISLVDGVVQDLVTSDQFSTIWAESLRFTHERAVAIMQESPDAALQLADDGVLSVDLGVVIARVKADLTERGVGFADLIPVIDRSVPIAHADALVTVRTVYQLAVSTGYWLPWVVLALVIGGALLAVDRRRALVWTSIGFSTVFLLFAAAIGIGKGLFVGAVSPAVMSDGAAQSMFDILTTLLSSTIVALALGGALVALWAWTGGSSPTARKLRGAAESGFSSLRHAGERHGITSGRFGVAVDRFRGPIVLAAMGVAIVIVMANRPVSIGLIVGVGATLLVLVLTVEIVRRPHLDSAPASMTASADRGRQEAPARGA